MARRRMSDPFSSMGKRGYAKELGPANRQINKKRVSSIPRGGFAIGNMPPGARKHVNDAVDHVAAGNHGKAAESLKKAGLSAMKEATFERVHNVINGDNGYKKRPLSTGDGNAEPVEAPMHDTSSNPHTAHVTHEAGKSVMLGASVMQTHKTRLTTGRPTSQSIWKKAKQNGLTRKVLYDSKISEAGEKYFFTRAQLDHSSGFNSRNFVVLGPSAYVTIGDFAEMANVQPGDTQPTSSDQKAYFEVLDTSTEFQFHNQAAYSSMELKIHLVKQRGKLETTPVNRLLIRTINTDPNVQEEAHIPTWYQHSAAVFQAGSADPSDVTRGETLDWDHSLKGPGLTSSDHFQEDYKIVKTVSKKLDAGDIWNFRHTHKYGPGMDATIVYNSMGTGGLSGERNVPANYFYIFEAKGQVQEAIYYDGTPPARSYIGTGPSYYTLEARKTFRFARQEVPGATASLAGFPEGTMGARVYTNRPLDSENQKELFVLSQNIKASKSLSAGEMFIPTLSDSVGTVELSKSTATDTGV